MLSKFNSYIEAGLIKKQISPCGRLALFDYTEKCQFEKAWDEVTLNARGTVYELETGRIVARSFPKFFNWSELKPEEQSGLTLNSSFETYEKLDGSLGIVYFYDNEWRVNTRGSFTSDQAIKGLELLQPYKEKLDNELTYLVEIIYPENRIVVDYKGESKLVFLTSFHTERGSEIEGCPFDYRAKKFKFNSIIELQEHLKTLSFNEEGYVVRFSDGTRAKFKGDEYIEMHRVVTGISPLVLWENMKNGVVDPEFMAKIPEEFRERYEPIALSLAEKAAKTWSYVLTHAAIIGWILGLELNKTEMTSEIRRKLGIYLKENPHKFNVYVFPLYLKQDNIVWSLIHKDIRPTGNKME